MSKRVYLSRDIAGLPERRYALGATHHCVDRYAGAPGTHPGAVRALEPQGILSLRLAAGLSPPRPGPLGLPSSRWAPSAVEPQAEKTPGGADCGWATRRGR